MKNCINFTRRREICRLQEFSSSHYPSQSLRAFWWQNVSYRNCYLLRFVEQQQIYVFTVRRRFDSCHGNIRIEIVFWRDFTWGIILDWRCYQHVLILFYEVYCIHIITDSLSKQCISVAYNLSPLRFLCAWLCSREGSGFLLKKRGFFLTGSGHTSF